MENNDEPSWFAGVDWASAKHDVCVLDRGGKIVAEKAFPHDGSGLAQMADWISGMTGGATLEAIAVAIEVPHGPVVESLMERGFRVFAINPKQLDRFRDRFSPAGAKDDRRDARVLADALRTDREKAFRPLAALDPLLVELREWSRIAKDSSDERIRVANRLREQLWRYFPQIIALDEDIAANWLLSLLGLAPSPETARRLRKSAIETVLKRHRIRRIDADEVMAKLREPAIAVAPGTVAAASAHVKILVEQLVRINRQIAAARQRIDELTAEIAEGDDSKGQRQEQRDVPILLSLTGLGTINTAALLAEAGEPLRRRDYHALRCLAGTAPVTLRSGKSRLVQRRRAVNRRLADAVFHWARVAVQHDPRSKAKYSILRARGHNHARALRSVADRLLFVACKMLKTQTTFDRNHRARNAPPP